MKEKRENLGGCSGVAAILYRERLHDKIKMIRNTMNDVIWMILKTDEGKQEKVCIKLVNHCEILKLVIYCLLSVHC
jgi:hypothetical protein